ncbi:MAG: class II aldolase/adducin family protein [Pseudomonadota bacterium]
MGNSNAALAAHVKAFCARIGADSLLVQGAGGNVSWKDDGVLWVKASGMRLADAASKEIFVPVNLPHLQNAIAQSNFSVVPDVVDESSLKPSIETLLHALMPHPLVVHLHPVQVLSLLVRRDCEMALASLIGSAFSWRLVGYHKPGLHLAEGVSQALKQASGSGVLFLQNHGVVVGADSIAEAEDIIQSMVTLCDRDRAHVEDKSTTLVGMPPKIDGYQRVSSPVVQQLALNPVLFAMLEPCWALYPDHVVFLGSAPHTCASAQDFQDNRDLDGGQSPDLIFILGDGVYVKPTFSGSKAEQLQCYAEVLMRQRSPTGLNPLSTSQVDELLNWDAEKYRIQMSK